MAWAQVPSLAQELPHALGMAKQNKTNSQTKNPTDLGLSRREAEPGNLSSNYSKTRTLDSWGD